MHPVPQLGSTRMASIKNAGKKSLLSPTRHWKKGLRNNESSDSLSDGEEVASMVIFQWKSLTYSYILHRSQSLNLRSSQTNAVAVCGSGSGNSAVSGYRLFSQTKTVFMRKKTT